MARRVGRDHRERETLTITDRSYVVCAGKILVSGDAATVLNDPHAQQYYFGTRFDGESIIKEKQTFHSTPRSEEPPQNQAA